ncbi:MAG: YtxH domain-containing protein [Bacteroidota bacterium]
MSSGKIITAVLAAAGGAAIGILLAPEKGSETRRRIAYKYDEYADEVGEKFKSAKDNLSEKVENLKAKAKNKKEEIEETIADDLNASQYAVAQEERFTPGSTL